MSMKKGIFGVVAASVLAVTVFPMNASAAQYTKEDLEAASKSLASAQEIYNEAKAAFDEGVYGFYESRGSNNAISILNNARYASFTKKGDPKDATSLDNVKASFQWIRKCNALRASEGVGELTVSDDMMAMSQSDTNWSDSHIAHADQFYVGENLAWGYQDPFSGWYTAEKAEYLKGETGSAGHYLNIINGEYGVTGYSICTRGGNGYGTTHGQTFDFEKDGEDVDTYEKEFLSYYDSVNPSNKKKAVDTLQKYYNTVNKALNGVKMYRLYNKNSGEHFYTASSGERNSLQAAGWNYEGIGWIAPSKSNTPVYRLYNKYAGDHHYTMSAAERNHLISIGWKDEGIGWYSDDDKDRPLYRQYNKNAKAGSHNYTLSKSENDQLVKAGWSAEGVGWYGISTEAKEMPDVSSLLK